MYNVNSVRLNFCGDIDMLDLVQIVGDRLGRQAGLDDEALHWISVAVHESVTNAIQHGNCGDTSKCVHVTLTCLGADSGLAITVRDEGCGFDPDGLPNPLAPENLLKPSGRGIFLIRSFMDELEVRRAQEGGMELVMVKRPKPVLS
jgi:serine/threonine-protein kinase RsbW